MIKMFKSKSLFKFLTFVIIFNVFIASKVFCVSERKVKIIPMPDCEKFSICKKYEKNDSYPNIIYAKASTSRHDNIHYVYSTLKLPSILMIHTTGSQETELKFNWTKLLVDSESIENAIYFDSGNSTNIKYRFAVAFTKLIEYDDIDDNADLDDTNKKVNWTVRYFDEFMWNSYSDLDLKDKTFTFSSNNVFHPSEPSNGTMSFKFEIFDKDGRSSKLPRMKYNANETELNFELDQFFPSFKHSRFALEVVAITNYKMGNNMTIENTRTIDDEYAPGVFTITDWLFKPKNKNVGGFFQWKPVCYFDKDRGRMQSTKVKEYNLQDVYEPKFTDGLTLLNRTVISAFFGKDLWNRHLANIEIVNISFGQPKDGFYVKNNYTVWTAAIGYGTPPQDAISKTVIIIISCGLGLPVLIIIFGGGYVCAKKVFRKKESYEPISSRQNEKSQAPVN